MRRLPHYLFNAITKTQVTTAKYVAGSANKTDLIVSEFELDHAIEKYVQERITEKEALGNAPRNRDDSQKLMGE